MGGEAGRTDEGPHGPRRGAYDKHVRHVGRLVG